MNISPRTQTLIDRLPKNHPLTPQMRDAMIAAHAASEQFSGHKIALASDGRRTPIGQRDELRAALTNKYGKQLARAAQPVLRARKEINARRAALAIKSVDKTDIAAALERQEIRAWVRQLDLGVRQSVVLATKDRRILEALVTAPPELSGITGASAALEIENRYIELTYPDELAAIEEMNAVVAEAEASMHIARNEMRSTIDLHPHDFDELMKPIETIRPWLVDDGRQVCEVGADGRPTYRKANETDLADGVRYENFEAYKRAQGLADAA